MSLKKVVFKVVSIREYKKDGDKGAETYIRIDQHLYEGDAFAEMDSTVYDWDDFLDIHMLYKKIEDAGKLAHGENKSPFEYDYSEWTRYVARVKAELARMA